MKWFFLRVARWGDKKRENRLRWYRRVQRRHYSHITRRVQQIRVESKRRNLGIRVYRPKKNIIFLKLKKNENKDRALWRGRTHYADPKYFGKMCFLKSYIHLLGQNLDSYYFLNRDKTVVAQKLQPLFQMNYHEPTLCLKVIRAWSYGCYCQRRDACLHGG